MTSVPEQRQHHTFIWLDVARAIAAIVVLAGHLRAFVFQDFVALAHPNPAWRALYFVTSLQHQAVIVFFVLSGFLISKSISEQEASNRWSWRRYTIKRVSRLWIVLLPALVLTFVWDQLGIRLTGSELYSGSLNVVNHSTPVGPLSYSLTTFLGNVFFLQSIVVPTFGTDTPLWSLANEFWYYVVFPLFFFGLGKRYGLSTRLILCATGTALCLSLLRTQCPLGLVWLMGYAAYLLHRNVIRHSEPKRRTYVTLTAILFAAVIVCSKVIKLSDLTQDYITGLSFALLLVSLASFNAWNLIARPAKLFAGFSYTLYVVHFPFLAFVTSAFIQNRRVPPSAHGLVTFLMLFVAAMAYAYCVSLLFERNTTALQAALDRYLGGIFFRRRSSNVALRTE